MKKKFEIIKSRLYAKTDYTELIGQKRLGGIGLSYGELESLPLRSGAICVFDAYNHGAVNPYMQKFDFESCTPFYMSVPTSLGNKIALAGLKFSEETATVWKLAVFEEKDVIKLTAESLTATCFIESGIVCIGDISSLREYEKAVKRHGEHDSHPLDGKLSFDGNAAFTYRSGAKHAVAVFSSGWGEGNYPCYIGYSESGAAVRFICDFGLLDYGYKEDSSQTVSFEFDVDAEELYINDPELNVDENNVKKWTFVLGLKDELDVLTLYKAYSRRGYALHSLGRTEAALSDYYAALSIAENNDFGNNIKLREWTLYENAGTINRNLGNTAEAVRLFEKAKNLGDSFYTGAYVNLIDIYTDEKNYDKAVEICGEMIEKRPLDPTPYMRRAEIFVSLGNYSAAAEDYGILINKFMWEDGIWDKISCLISLGRLDDAENDLKLYIAENPLNEQYYYFSGLIANKRHDYEKSYEYLAKSCEFNPEYIPALGLLIETDDLFLDYDGVLRSAERYIECRPSSVYGYHIRLEQNMRLGNYLFAAKDGEYIAENFGGGAEVCRGIVCAYIMAKEFAKAKKAVKRAKNIDSACYANAFGLYCIAKGNRAKGEKLLLSAASSGKSETYLADLADAYIYSGKFDSAEEYIAKLEKTDPLSARSVFSRIALCRKTNDMKGLKSVLDGYIEKFLPGIGEEQADKVKTRLINYPFCALICDKKQ